MSNWTDESKAKLIEAYLKAEPTPENSMGIVEALADEFDASPNGVRMILSKAEVYVKKTPATAAAKTASADKPASTRVSKESAQAALVAAIQKAGKTVDQDIISKLTGKAAVYFTEILS